MGHYITLNNIQSTFLISFFFTRYIFICNEDTTLLQLSTVYDNSEVQRTHAVIQQSIHIFFFTFIMTQKVSVL